MLKSDKVISRYFMTIAFHENPQGRNYRDPFSFPWIVGFCNGRKGKEEMVPLGLGFVCLLVVIFGDFFGIRRCVNNLGLHCLWERIIMKRNQ